MTKNSLHFVGGKDFLTATRASEVVVKENAVSINTDTYPLHFIDSSNKTYCKNCFTPHFIHYPDAETTRIVACTCGYKYSLIPASGDLGMPTVLLENPESKKSF